MKFGEH